MVVRVLHLVGSATNDFLGELSQLYARGCLDATADRECYEFHIALVTPDLTWRFPRALDPATIAAAEPMDLARAIGHLSALRIDVMVPQMFCLPGMTAYRALFDVLNIPYPGSAPDVMALGADKAKTRAVVAAAGVPVPVGEVLRRGDVPTLVPPVVVKPVTGDNSLGVGKVDEVHEFDAALATAFTYSTDVLVESYIELGREVRCGTVVRDGKLIALPLEEYRVDSASKPIRNYADKIGRAPDGGLTLVAKDTSRAWVVDPGDPLTQRVWRVAEQAHEALGCRDYSLFDFRIDPQGRPWFLEAGLYCSFAPDSVIVSMAQAAGTPLRELFDRAIRGALER